MRWFEVLCRRQFGLKVWLFQLGFGLALDAIDIAGDVCVGGVSV